MQSPAQTLIAELEASVQGGSSDKRLNTLRRVADLLLNEPDHFNDEQIQVFDDVLCLLIKHVEDQALAELSGRLAPVARGPEEVIRQLARHEAIAVAGPVLSESKTLTTAELADIARSKSQQHLLAISGRDGTETVRARLLANAPLQLREEISRVLATISSTVAAQVGKPAELPAVERNVRSLYEEGRLDEATVLRFALAGKREELAMALALLSSTPFKIIAELLSGLRTDAVLIPCKAAKLSWPTVEAILRSRITGYALPTQVFELARNDYGKLSLATAQRTLRFLQLRGSVA